MDCPAATSGPAVSFRGEKPLVGIFAAYASVSTGMAANLLISMSDVLAGTFTISAAQSIDPGFSGNIAMNYYFLIVSLPLFYYLQA